MTIKEIAELCGVEERTVRNWCHGKRFLRENFSLRNVIVKKLEKGSPERPSDFSLEETLAIIGDGGGNKTLAAMLEENHALEAQKALKTHENSLLPLSFNGFTVRTLTINNEQWWIAKDVCDVLELVNSRKALVSLPEDEKITVTSSYGNPRNGVPHQLSAVNEPGLYRLIFLSRKPCAEKFKNWVFKEVLPNIRKNGVYDATGAINDRLERIEKALSRIERGQNAQSGYTALPLPEDTHADILRFGGKFLEITGNDADFIEANVLFKLFFRHAMTVPINSKKFFEELSYIFPQLRLDSSRKHNPVFRGCIIK
ncbi:hypothetical protein E4O00_03260 [Treponema sp. OMZ 788]|uniref:BRO family protein n=1 Tax=Treponema sp. OMZ 788 TaxID=2563664 RepID=UPI0020A4FF58|nr:BRO family protein [Treponema sp. OMZ 788]UTC65198.1 hypothetical protein E4O00_03260 [Treponema sp. OMZ 788]